MWLLQLLVIGRLFCGESLEWNDLINSLSSKTISLKNHSLDSIQIKI